MRQSWWNWFLPAALAGVCLYLIYLMFTHPSETENEMTENDTTDMGVLEMDITGFRVD